MKQLYVTAQSGDDTSGHFTFSKDLSVRLNLSRSKAITNYEKIDNRKLLFIFLFWHIDKECFAFELVGADKARTRQTSPIGYSPVSGEYGFVSTIPSVEYIFHRLAINSDKAIFKVVRERVGTHIIYNLIPNEATSK